MGIRKKTICLVGGIFIALAISVVLLARTVLLDRFAQLEIDLAQRNLQRVIHAIEREVENLDRTVFDWSAWDEVYNFVVDGNQTFVEENLVDEVFDETGLRLNLMLFLNTSGAEVHAKGFDRDAVTEVPVPRGLNEHLRPDGLLRHPDLLSTVRGFVTLPDGVFLVASRPILTSVQKGPPRGTLLMGRFFDPREIGRVGAATELEVSGAAFDPASVPADLARRAGGRNEPTTMVYSLEGQLVGAATLPDIYGQPSLVVKTPVARSIYLQGKQTIFLLGGTAGLAVLIFGALTLALLERTVLSRLAELKAGVDRAGGGGSPFTRLQVTGGDELSALGRGINEMFGRLEHHEAELVRLERLRALGEMAAGVNHNLNNILTSVALNAELARELTEDGALLKRIDRIRSATAKAEDLVSKLQTSSLGREAADPAVDVNRTILEAVDAARPRWQDESESRGVAVTVDTDLEDDLPPAACDAKELFNALLNLLFNALDAMPQGGRIKIRSRAGGGGVTVVVEDDGSGMEEEVRRRVFEPFFTTKSTVGTGLGLSTVYNTARRWGGEVSVSSTPGDGSVFTLQLRAAPAAAAAAVHVNAMGAERRGSVLVVDDQEMVCDSILDLLSDTHAVAVAPNGERALEQFSPGRFDVVLTDLGMPGMNGSDLARLIRGRDPAVSLVLMTGWTLAEGDDRLAPFDLHLRKPFDGPGDVLRAVSNAIALRDRRQRETAKWTEETRPG